MGISGTMAGLATYPVRHRMRGTRNSRRHAIVALQTGIISDIPKDGNRKRNAHHHSKQKIET